MPPTKDLKEKIKIFQAAWGCATIPGSGSQENSEIVRASAGLTERISFIFYIAEVSFLHPLFQQGHFNAAFMLFALFADFWLFCPENCWQP